MAARKQFAGFTIGERKARLVMANRACAVPFMAGRAQAERAGDVLGDHGRPRETAVEASDAAFPCGPRP